MIYIDKILVIVYAITLEEEYDIFLPVNLEMSNALKVIQQTINELSSGMYNINPKAVLYDSNGNVINFNNTVRFSGLKNGCKVILM